MLLEFGLNIFIEMIYYGVIKIVLLSLFCGLVKCMAGTGVTVNAVLFGFMLSEGVKDMLKYDLESGKFVEEVG